MNKFKCTIFIFIVVICSLIIAYPYITDLINSYKNIDPEEMTIKSGEYIVGEDINQGIYDIEVISGKIKFMQRELSIKDKILGVKLNNGEHVEVEGKGRVKLSPANFEAIEMSKSGQYEINHSGFYKIGLQLPEREYILSYTGKTEKEKPFVQILSSNNRDVLNTYDFQDKESYKVFLKKGDILEINKCLFFESDSIVINLKPL
ncbi:MULTISPECIES: hypothetical protein [Neobacillus]|jgi:hypothetical protein|uniref:DUF2140 family protein n=1 Tax=Neobacillus sedimentimangrovi TaxID=2699460 RepID=A0ABS8QK42_9BACI|nr:hypothetical protein [Neobacillus sedimentimangrovi]AIM15974.1 hypothetical protein HW35_06265 [Bacillus sp. X1(2014)]MCD4839649.1 hypothetical protein [Neobacillus sedimentimangrovi]